VPAVFARLLIFPAARNPSSMAVSWAVEWSRADGTFLAHRAGHILVRQLMVRGYAVPVAYLARATWMEIPGKSLGPFILLPLLPPDGRPLLHVGVMRVGCLRYPSSFCWAAALGHRGPWPTLPSRYKCRTDWPSMPIRSFALHAPPHRINARPTPSLGVFPVRLLSFFFRYRRARWFHERPSRSSGFRSSEQFSR